MKTLPTASDRLSMTSFPADGRSSQGGAKKIFSIGSASFSKKYPTLGSGFNNKKDVGDASQSNARERENISSNLRNSNQRLYNILTKQNEQNVILQQILEALNAPSKNSAAAEANSASSTKIPNIPLASFGKLFKKIIKGGTIAGLIYDIMEPSALNVGEDETLQKMGMGKRFKSSKEERDAAEKRLNVLRTSYKEHEAALNAYQNSIQDLQKKLQQTSDPAAKQQIQKTIDTILGNITITTSQMGAMRQEVESIRDILTPEGFPPVGISGFEDRPTITPSSPVGVMPDMTSQSPAEALMPDMISQAPDSGGYEIIKFQATKIKFDGLKLPTQTVSATEQNVTPQTPLASSSSSGSAGSFDSTVSAASRIMTSASGASAESTQQQSGSADRGSASEAIQFFQSKGWSPAQAAGLAASLKVDSPNFDPAEHN